MQTILGAYHGNGNKKISEIIILLVLSMSSWGLIARGEDKALPSDDKYIAQLGMWKLSKNYEFTWSSN
jgi:hypothetical protein